MDIKIDWTEHLRSMTERYPDYSMTETIYATILDLIVSFRIPPGTKLVTLRLAEEMGVSMTPVRDALKLLEENGFISTNAGRKTFVAEYSEESCSQLRALRISLECLAAEQVCETAGDELINELKNDVEDNIRLWEKCKDNFDYYHLQITADLNFHRKLVHSSQNRFLIEQYDRIWPSITFVRQFFSPFGFCQAEYPQAHRAIPMALATRDPKFARAAMMMHFKNIYSAELIEQQHP